MVVPKSDLLNICLRVDTMDKESLKSIHDMCENDDIEDKLRELYSNKDIEKDVFDFFNEIILKKDRKEPERSSVPKDTKRVTFADPVAVEYETLRMEYTSE